MAVLIHGASCKTGVMRLSGSIVLTSVYGICHVTTVVRLTGPFVGCLLSLSSYGVSSGIRCVYTRITDVCFFSLRVNLSMPYGPSSNSIGDGRFLTRIDNSCLGSFTTPLALLRSFVRPSYAAIIYIVSYLIRFTRHGSVFLWLLFLRQSKQNVKNKIRHVSM